MSSSRQQISQPKPRLVIIGSGWAGFYISQHISLKAYNVTVLSPRRTTAYTPLLASAAVGLFSFYLAEEPIRSRSRSDLKFHKANVLSVDFEHKTCHCAPAFDEDADLVSNEFTIEYDFLVIAPGCNPNTFNTPGVDSQSAIFIKNVSDAMRVRKTLFDLLEKASLPSASEQRVRELLHIAIVGGGPTGIELTAELDDLCKHELQQLYPEVAKHVSISIYDVAPNILSAYEQSLHEYATGQLTKRNIEVAPNTKIERVENNTLYIKGRDPVPYGMLIWATGNKNVTLVENLDVRTPERGLKRILTDDRCRVFKSQKGLNNDTGSEVWDTVFAIGDAADIEHASLPTTAEVACQKARYLVDNLNLLESLDKYVLSVNNSNTNTVDSSAMAAAWPKVYQKAMFTSPFAYKQKQLVSYIGQHDGVIAGKGNNDPGWTGQSAWVAWRSGSIMWNRNWRSRVVMVITLLLNALFGKEIARM